MEGGYPLLAGVAEAPAVILRSIDEVDVSVDEDGDGRQSPVLSVPVHALDDQEPVVESSGLGALPPAVPPSGALWTLLRARPVRRAHDSSVGGLLNEGIG